MAEDILPIFSHVERDRQAGAGDVHHAATLASMMSAMDDPAVPAIPRSGASSSRHARRNRCISSPSTSLCSDNLRQGYGVDSIVWTFWWD
jgi:hypothetical protein